MYRPFVLILCWRAVLNPALNCTYVAQQELCIWGQAVADNKGLNIIILWAAKPINLADFIFVH